MVVVFLGGRRGQLLLFPQHYNTDSTSKKECPLLVNVSKVGEAKKKGDKVVEGRGPLVLV